MSLLQVHFEDYWNTIKLQIKIAQRNNQNELSVKTSECQMLNLMNNWDVDYYYKSNVDVLCVE